MSDCDNCTQHLTGFSLTCIHNQLQTQLADGRVLSRILECPYFDKKPELMTYEEFAAKRGYA